MTTAKIQQVSLATLIEQAYSDGYACHGNLNPPIEEFISHLIRIIQKYVGSTMPLPAALNFLTSLHINDLYLSIACAQPSDAAWRRFLTTHQNYIHRAARVSSETEDAAEELTSGVVAHIFMPDASGRSRIASYNGCSSLTVWLAVIIKRMAAKQRQRKSHHFERIESVPDAADRESITRIEVALRASKYGSLTRNSVIAASKSLTDHERLILRLRYVQELQVSEIARQFEVNPSAISRQLDRTQRKLRNQIVSALACRYELSEAAIAECLDDLVENPEHSILAFATWYRR